MWAYFHAIERKNMHPNFSTHGTLDYIFSIAILKSALNAFLFETVLKKKLRKEINIRRQKSFCTYSVVDWKNMIFLFEE